MIFKLCRVIQTDNSTLLDTFLTTLPIKFWTPLFKYLNYIQEAVSSYKIGITNF